MKSIEVRHVEHDRFDVRIRGHDLVVDQPVEEGGTDAGPAPTELFVAGLASCVAFYAGRFLQRHNVAPDGFGVRCAFRMSDGHPARVAEVELAVDLPPRFPVSRREALLRVVERCTVHNTLRTPPEVRISLVAHDDAA